MVTYAFEISFFITKKTSMQLFLSCTGRRLLLFTISSSLIILLPGCLRKFDNYGITGAIISNPANAAVTVLVAENSATSYQKNGGFVKTTYTTTYWLKQYDALTGKLNIKKKVFTPGEANKLSIACYGRYGNTIWMHINGLTAFDINSLEEVTNEKDIATKNGLDANLFPVDDRLITPGLGKGYIDFIAANGEAYRIGLNDLKISKKQEAENDDDAVERKINRLIKNDDYGVRCDTFNGKLFAFAKNETAARESAPGYGSISEAAYRVKLYKAGYSVRRLGMHNSITPENVEAAGGDTYLNPCFVMDKQVGNIIHLSNPDGYIVMQQDVLGEKSKAIISRIDTSGRVIWEKRTTISTKTGDCTLQGRYLLLSTNKDYMFSPFIGKDALCIVNIENGQVILPSLGD